MADSIDDEYSNFTICDGFTNAENYYQTTPEQRALFAANSQNPLCDYSRPLDANETHIWASVYINVEGEFLEWYYKPEV